MAPACQVAKEAREDTSDAKYSAAKERCDAMSGAAKDIADDENVRKSYLGY